MGSVQETRISLPLTVVVGAVGWSGVAAAKIATGAEKALKPKALRALTLNVYVTPSWKSLSVTKVSVIEVCLSTKLTPSAAATTV